MKARIAPLLITIIATLAAGVDSATAENLPWYQMQMQSEDGFIRAEAMRKFAIEKYEKYEDGTEELIWNAINDSNDDVVESAVYALWYLVTFLEVVEERVPDRNEEFMERLMIVIESHPNTEAAVSAINTYYFVNRSTAEIETIVIGRVMDNLGERLNAKLLHTISSVGLQHAENEAKILEIMRGPPRGEVLRAAKIALKSNIDPTLFLSDAIRLASSEELFAHPDLLVVFSENPRLAVEYVHDLEEIRHKMLAELQKDGLERSVAISNDEFGLTKLNETIETLQSVQ